MSNNIVVSNAKAIQTRIFGSRDQIQKLLPAGLDVDRFMQIAWGLIRKNSRLLECTAESIIAGIGQGAQLGLSFDSVLGQMFLVPYWNSKKNCREAQAQVGYRGLANLAYRSEKIIKIFAEVVHKDDEFSLTLGTEPKIHHVPNPNVDREKEDEWKGVYAVAVTKEGATFFKYLTAAEVYKRRAVSRSTEKPDSPWNTSPKEMWLKCPVRALAKLLPMSPDTEQAIRAAIEDEYRDAGEETPEAIDGSIEVETAALPPKNGQKASPEPPQAQERRTYALTWRDEKAEIAVLQAVPKEVDEQAKFRDLFTKSGKVWYTTPACFADAVSLFDECGHDLILPPEGAEAKAGVQPSPTVAAPAPSLQEEIGF